jgi:hypothetical protein
MAASSAMEVEPVASSAMEVEPEEAYVPDDFEGAAQREGTLDRIEHKCELCSEKYLQWSCMAYLKVETKGFRMVMDTTLSQARQSVTGEFGNLAIEGRVVLACVLCCERHHETHYTKASADGKGFVITSAFKEAARRTKPSMKSKKKKIQNAMACLEDRMNRDAEPGKEVDIRKAFDLMEQSNISKAIDWVTELALTICFLYGCPNCKIVPTSSGSWFRCNATIEKMTGLISGGHWRCGHCLNRYTQGGANYRLLVLGDPTEYHYFYIGESSPGVEAKIKFLQTCALVKVLGDQEVTKEVLYECIQALNDVVGRRLSKFKEVTTITAGDPYVSNGVHIFCSDARLYLSSPGQRYSALDLSKEDIEVLDEAGQHDILDFAFALTDWTLRWPKAPSLRKVYWGLKTSASTAAGHAALIDSLARHRSNL